MVNDQGGVAGRKINFISYDDGYSPPKTVEQVRRLVEQDKVAFLFNTLGTPTNSAIQRYVNQKKVPHLFVATGADKWGDYKHFPWTMGWQPSYRDRGADLRASTCCKQKPNAKIAILYQNDDFGKDYLVGVQGRAGRQVRQDRGQGDHLRDDRRDGRQPDRRRCRPPAPTCCWSRAIPEIRRPDRSARSMTSNWKPMFFMTNVVDLGRRGDEAGRAGKGDRHDHQPVSEGPDRSGLGERSPA